MSCFRMMRKKKEKVLGEGSQQTEDHEQSTWSVTSLSQNADSNSGIGEESLADFERQKVSLCAFLVATARGFDFSPSANDLTRNLSHVVTISNGRVSKAAIKVMQRCALAAELAGPEEHVPSKDYRALVGIYFLLRADQQ